ncbi:MAG: O-antigen ligase family protein [Candidatus Curtissbacteria bacterium]
MDFLKLFLVATLLTLIPGQILRIPPASQLGALTLSDISVFLLDGLFIFYALSIRKSLKFPNRIVFPFILFIAWAISTLTRAMTVFTVAEVATSALFIARFAAYFFLSVVCFNIVTKAQATKWVNLILFVGTLYALIGFVQFVIIPDLTFLTPLGWDPHQRRIVSTIIDPNFSGYIFVLIFSLATSLYLSARQKTPYALMAIVSFVALILTFSRSSYLAFIAAVTVIGLIKSRKLLVLALLTLFLIFTIVPQVRARVVGALTIDETSQARIESWQNATVVIRDNPIFGVGFNTYRFAQERYNFFSPDNPLGGHSGGGVDSSLLLVLATTGAVGLFLFALFLTSVAKTVSRDVGSDPLRLAMLASFAALLVHSLFVNSLFFPQIMLLIFPLIGLASKDDTK